MAQSRHYFGAPFPFDASGAAPAAVAFVIDAAADKLQFVFQAAEATTITHLGFRYSARTGTPVQHRICLQGITNGVADGTIKGGGSPASALFTPPADTSWDGTVQWIALTNSYVCTQSERLAIVIEPVGTPNGSNSGSFTQRWTGFGRLLNIAFPYSVAVNAGTPARNVVFQCFGYKSAAKAYGNLFSNITTTTFNSGSGTDEFGLRFLLSSDLVETYTVVGMRFYGAQPATGGTVKMTLYNGTTVLQEFTWDTDDAGTTAAANYFIFEWLFDEATLTQLNAGQEYRIAIAPQETGTNCGFSYVTCVDASDLSMFGGGTEFHLISRVNAGAWVDEPSARPICELIIDDWTIPAGSVGGDFASGSRFNRGFN